MQKPDPSDSQPLGMNLNDFQNSDSFYRNFPQPFEMEESDLFPKRNSLHEVQSMDMLSRRKSPDNLQLKDDLI